jgi:plasmid maintenance system antidote protein VapI
MAKETYPYQPDYATPPGYVLEDHLEARGLTPAEFASRHSLSTELIEGVIDGSAPIDSELAAIFDLEFSLEACVWLSMEAIYRRRLEHKAATDAASAA